MARRIVKTPAPRDVDGFTIAQRNGQTPQVSSSPPELNAPAAKGLFKAFGITLASSAVVWLLLVIVVFPPTSTLAGTALALAAAAVGIIVSRAAMIRFRRVFVQELQAGYTTVKFQQGLFWSAHTAERRFFNQPQVVGWNWSGSWVLKSGGTVESAPKAGAPDPPGLYPSPHAPGERELWTGHQWTFVYVDRIGEGPPPAHR